MPTEGANGGDATTEWDTWQEQGDHGDLAKRERSQTRAEVCVDRARECGYDPFVCARSLTDKVPVFGTGYGGSIPSGRTT